MKNTISLSSSFSDILFEKCKSVIFSHWKLDEVIIFNAELMFAFQITLSLIYHTQYTVYSEPFAYHVAFKDFLEPQGFFLSLNHRIRGIEKFLDKIFSN